MPIQAAIASWSHLLHLLIHPPPDPKAPNPYEPAAGAISSMFLALAGDYRALNTSQGNENAQMHVQWHLIPLVRIPQVLPRVVMCPEGLGVVLSGLEEVDGPSRSARETENGRMDFAFVAHLLGQTP